MFAFIENTNSNKLLDCLKEYINFVKTTKISNRIFSPLVIFFEKTFNTLKEEQDFAWKQIQFLHNNDDEKWPLDIPLDTNNFNWSFCFNSIQLFFNINCPHHLSFKNRNLGSNIVFVINPRENFDFVANLHTKKGKKIRQIIRNRLKIYNNGVIPNVLGFFGDTNNLEWKQYVLDELNLYQECPLKINENQIC